MSKRFIYVGLVAGLLASFQNCGPGFGSLVATSNDSTRASGPLPAPAPVPVPMPVPVPSPTPIVGPLIISGQSGKVYSGLKISSTQGDCVQIINSTNITIENSNIGPCAGHGVRVTGGSGINIYDSYIHVENKPQKCCDTRDGVKIEGAASTITVQGNVIAYNETNVRIDQRSTGVVVHGNFLLNPLGPFPRGQNLQSDTAFNITVSNNYALSSKDTTRFLFPAQQEDSINFYKTQGSVARENYVSGAQSASGCGLITDDGSSNNQYLDNIVSDSGQCGIGIATGTNQVVSGNKVLNTNSFAGGGNTAIYVWNQYASSCGSVVVTNNIADQIKPDGSHSGFWNGGNCGAISMNGNTFDAAASTVLSPFTVKYPPPAIPPGPKKCVAKSPYSTQKSMQGCP